MEASRKAKNVKSTASSVKYEAFAHCFLRLQWHEFLQQSRTVNKKYYLEGMEPIARSNSSETNRIVEKPIMDLASR